MSIVLPDKRTVHQFEHASVVYTAELSAATGKVMPKLYVQAIDQYSFQRELSVGRIHEPGDSKKILWESHIYQHPGRRFVQNVSESVAKRFTDRFLELCETYPALLFNKTGDHSKDVARPRHEGFVRLAEMMHRGEFSVKLLD